MKHAHSVNYHFSRPFCACMCVAYHQTKDKIADDFHLSLPFLTLAKPRKDKARVGASLAKGRRRCARAASRKAGGKVSGSFWKIPARVLCACVRRSAMIFPLCRPFILHAQERATRLCLLALGGSCAQGTGARGLLGTPLYVLGKPNR